MGQCKECGKTDAEVDFYNSIRTYCKEHWRDRVKSNRRANIEKYREYDRIRANLPHRVEARFEYQQTDAFARSHGIANRKYRNKHPDRAAARYAVNNAIRDGKISPLPCLICGEKAEAHHPDYSDPLFPVWLCPSHHRQAHALAAKQLKQE